MIAVPPATAARRRPKTDLIVKSYLYGQLNYIVQKRTPSTPVTWSAVRAQNESRRSSPLLAGWRPIPTALQGSWQFPSITSRSYEEAGSSLRRHRRRNGRGVFVTRVPVDPSRGRRRLRRNGIRRRAGAVKNAGYEVVISSRSGNAPAGDDSLVTRSDLAPWRKGTSPEVTNTVLLDLNCNAKVASATKRATPRPARGQGGAGGAEEGGGQERGGKKASASALVELTCGGPRSPADRALTGLL